MGALCVAKRIGGTTEQLQTKGSDRRAGAGPLQLPGRIMANHTAREARRFLAFGGILGSFVSRLECLAAA